MSISNNLDYKFSVFKFETRLSSLLIFHWDLSPWGQRPKLKVINSFAAHASGFQWNSCGGIMWFPLTRVSFISTNEKLNKNFSGKNNTDLVRYPWLVTAETQTPSSLGPAEIPQTCVWPTTWKKEKKKHPLGEADSLFSLATLLRS